MRKLWLRWVGANALGELVGLGGTLTLGGYLITNFGMNPLMAFGVAVLSGTIEATVVGFLQWRVLRSLLPQVSLRAWWLGTLAGALAAYVLGYLPSTLMDLAARGPEGPVATAEPPQWIVLLLAAGLGLVGGAVLSFAQWLILRKAARGAGIWLPANMAAWALGMPVIFWGIDAAQKGQPLAVSFGIMALALLAAGALVGAVHGLALVRLAREGADATGRKNPHPPSFPRLEPQPDPGAALAFHPGMERAHRLWIVDGEGRSGAPVGGQPGTPVAARGKKRRGRRETAGVCRAVSGDQFRQRSLGGERAPDQPAYAGRSAGDERQTVIPAFQKVGRRCTCQR